MRQPIVVVCNNRLVHVTRETAGRSDVVDAVLGASRVLVAVAARSLAGMDEDVTLPQYRALVVLASRGPQRIAALSAALDVGPSTGTRMCDRLERKELVRRTRVDSDRRAVVVELTPTGEQLVRDVTRRRRAEIGRILRRLSQQDSATVVAALKVLAAAAGEVPEQDWTLGWS